MDGWGHLSGPKTRLSFSSLPSYEGKLLSLGSTSIVPGSLCEKELEKKKRLSKCLTACLFSTAPTGLTGIAAEGSRTISQLRRTVFFFLPTCPWNLQTRFSSVTFTCVRETIPTFRGSLVMRL